MICPKCKQGRLVGNTVFIKSIECPSCGLFHEVGGYKESIYRQINGHDPREVHKRAMALKGVN